MNPTTANKPDNSPRMTPKQVAELWGVSPSSVIQLLKTGKLAGFKVGRLWRVSPETVRAYEEAGKREKLAPLNQRRRIVTRIS